MINCYCSRRELTHLPFNSQWHPLTTLSSLLEGENQTHDCFSSLCARTMHLRRGGLFMLQSSFRTRDADPPFSKAHLLPPPHPLQPSSRAPTFRVSFSCHLSAHAGRFSYACHVLLGGPWVRRLSLYGCNASNDILLLLIQDWAHSEW